METTTIIFDGMTYTVEIIDFTKITDFAETELELAHLYVTSYSQIEDTCSLDIISHVEEDPGFSIALSVAEKYKGINDIRGITVNRDTSDLIAMSNNFLFAFDILGNLLTKTFLKPIIEGDIIDIIHYGDGIYILDVETTPEATYIDIYDKVYLGHSLSYINKQHEVIYKGLEYSTYDSWEFYHLPTSFHIVKNKSYGAFNLLKYDLYGNLLFKREFMKDTIITPYNLDVVDDKIYICSAYTSTIVVLDLDGWVINTHLNNSLVDFPITVKIINDRYMWVVDKNRNTSMGYYYTLKKIDYLNNSVDEIQNYVQYPYFELDKDNFDTYILLRDKTTYASYKNFSNYTVINTLLHGHNIESYKYFNKHMYILNRLPTEIRIINLNNNTGVNIRECVNPLTIAGLLPEGNRVLIADAGLHDVSYYRFYSEKEDTIINFVFPTGIAKLGTTHYVVDNAKSNIYKINNNSTITTIGNTSIARPTDITSDGQYLYVIDSGRNGIFKLDSDCKVIKSIGSTGHLENQYNYPTSIEYRNNKLYILDSQNFRIQILNAETLNYISEVKLAPDVSPYIKPNLVYNPPTTLGAILNDTIYTLSGNSVKVGDYGSGQFKKVYLQFNLSQIGSENFDSIKSIKISCTYNRDISYGASTPIGTLTFSLEDTLASTEMIAGDPTRQELFINSYSIPYNTTPLTITSGELFPTCQGIMGLEGWNISNDFLVIIDFVSTSRATNNRPTLSNLTINVTYDKNVYVRRTGYFYHLTTDNTYIYVSDLVSNNINKYSIDTGGLVAKIPFSGTIMEKLTDDIFVTDKDCSLSYVEQFTWNKEATYSLELFDVTPVIYTFEHEWEYLTTYDFNLEYEFYEVDTFDWINIGNFIEVPTDNVEFELQVPEIIWE